MPQLIVKPLPVKREGCSSPGAAYRVHSSSCTGCSVRLGRLGLRQGP
ncbi:hypothetical protein KNP414_06100 [Paenibacillus mucilaginosus KNP414]|uniref:Uncharacterized protein n=1 Tax=Paenibacillus mucilaginosus (strain KNP414) TaxID=1036673 RepID=F8FGG4_PAEMK|nr:hypothetical protein KNP414_06100 [Paenibacillus mucilaginosus KNP414]